MIRRAASTPSAEKFQAQVGLGMGDVELAQGITTPPERFPGTVEATTVDLRLDSERAGVQDGVSGSAIEDALMKEEIEEPEYSPPEPVEPVNEPPPLSTVGQVNLPPEVTNVLAQLAQFRT